jgi:hypothetical protein
MKKRKLRAEFQYACEAVGYEPGDVAGLAERISRRVEDLANMREIASKWIKKEQSARASARLWKRAAKAYRHQRDAASQAIGHEREERDAARAEVDRWRTTAEEWEGKLREERDAATLQRERDAAEHEKALDDKRAKLVEVADKLRASRVDVDILQKAMARMRPVVEASRFALECGCWLPESVRSAVKAYRAVGEPQSAARAELRSHCTPAGVTEPVSLPDVQRTYRAPEGDTAERIAADATSDHARPTTWVVRRRIEADGGKLIPYESPHNREEGLEESDEKVRSALEAAAERAVAWWRDIYCEDDAPGAIRRAVMGESDLQSPRQNTTQ